MLYIYTRLKVIFGTGAFFYRPPKKGVLKNMKAVTNELMEMAQRIREMREIEEMSVEELAQKTEVSVDEYKAYESGQKDLPFTFIHKCALAFGIELSYLLGGSSPHLSSYTITRN